MTETVREREEQVWGEVWDILSETLPLQPAGGDGSRQQDPGARLPVRQLSELELGLRAVKQRSIPESKCRQRSQGQGPGTRQSDRLG